jgi:hypothetical protein
MRMEVGWNGADLKTELLREKPVPVPHWLPQISHGLAWYWNLTYVVGCQGLTASVVAWLATAHKWVSYFGSMKVYSTVQCECRKQLEMCQNNIWHLTHTFCTTLWSVFVWVLSSMYWVLLVSPTSYLTPRKNARVWDLITLVEHNTLAYIKQIIN